MKLKVLAFGAAGDAVGGQKVELELDKSVSNVSELKKALIQKYPELGKLVSFLIAVNAQYAYDKTRISSGDEIAIIPPTSGG